ncbi:MAG TPA: hypothetical protein VEH04_04205 [Verrucomicrobiae bacterium]|nr:hypothetical protein [Verrucomicrobiae bacterium]
MNTNLRIKTGWLCLAAAGAIACATVQAQPISFDHLNAGAAGTSQNDPLVWANGAAFVAESGYYYPMTYASSGRFAGHFNSSPTLVALSAGTLPAGLPPAYGSFIQVQLTLLSAPTGGSLGFWLTGDMVPTYPLNVGQSTPLIDLSNPLTAGDPGEDPAGHIHGRRFTATLPGDYLVGLQLFDTSQNGVGGGPIHTPSEMLHVNFRAVPEPVPLAFLGIALGGTVLLQIHRKRARRL